MFGKYSLSHLFLTLALILTCLGWWTSSLKYERRLEQLEEHNSWLETVHALGGEDIEKRRRAIESLIPISNVQDVPPILYAASDPVDEISELARKALVDFLNDQGCQLVPETSTRDLVPEIREKFPSLDLGFFPKG